jgi:nitroreductase
VINVQNQIFNKIITELIEERISVRTYEPEALKEKQRKSLVSYINNMEAPFNGNARFKVVDNETALNNNIKLGTYGVIKGASSFIASAIKDGDFNLEELGYKLEKIILYATSLGLGTCWIGGTFKKGEFSKAMEIQQNEILPIISPIGYKSKSRSVAEKFMRTVAGSDKRKQWEELFFHKSFENRLTKIEAGIFAEALEMVRLAPSASNKQPWRLIIEDNMVHFYICHAKGYSSALGFDMQRIDMGIAMCHFDLTLKEAGVLGSFKKVKQNKVASKDNIEYINSWVIENNLL